MAFNLKKETFSLLNPIKNIESNTVIDCRSTELESVPDSVLCVANTINLTGNEILSGKIKYYAKLFFICAYKTEDETKKCECAVEFTGEIVTGENTSDFIPDISLVVSNTEVKIDDRRLIFTANVCAKCDLFLKESVSLLSGGEEIFTKNIPTNIYRSCGIKNFSTPIFDDFELAYPVKEVLLHTENAIISSVTPKIDGIIVEGDAVVSLFLLQNDENSDIVKETRCFPFRIEFDENNITPTMCANSFLQVKPAIVDVTNYEDTAKCTVKIELPLLIKTELFEVKEYSITADAFSKTNDLSLNKGEVTMRYPLTNFTVSKKFCERVSLIEPFEVGSKVLGALVNKVTKNNVKIENKTLTADLTIFATAFIKSNDKGIFTFNYNFNLSIVEPINIDNSNNLEASISVCVPEIYTRAVTLTEIDSYGLVKIFVQITDKKTETVVFDATVTGEKQPTTHALNVFIAFSGEDLWSLSKRLNLSPEEVEKQNPELTFPLTGEEQIIIFNRKVKEYS